MPATTLNSTALSRIALAAALLLGAGLLASFAALLPIVVLTPYRLTPPRT